MTDPREDMTLEELIRASGQDPALIKFGRLVGRDLPSPFQMTLAQLERAAVGGRALDVADTLYCGLEQQFARISGSGPAEPELLRDLLAQVADAELTLVLLLRLRRAAVLIRTHVEGGDALETAITRFDSAVPDLKHLRDTYEHFDDYILGKGRHKPKSGTGRSYSYQSGGPPTIWRGDRSVNLSAAVAAARDLYEQIYKATVGERPHLLLQESGSGEP